MIEAKEHWRTSDSKGQIMPWYTRDCCAWLDTLDLKGKRVFEYGGGASTLWWKAQGCVVDGVDDQKEWADLAGIRFLDDRKKYLESIHIKGKFDIICIDGSHRDYCIDHALEELNEGGFIIIDNWRQGSADLAEWPNTENVIKLLKLKVVEYMEPDHMDWRTIVISRA